MQVIRLTRKWVQCRDHGHTVALKFRGITDEAKAIEDALRMLTGASGWWRGSAWYSWLGRPTSEYNVPRNFYISVKDEHILTMALLKVNH